MAAAVRVCAGSPLCEAQASASSSSLRPKRSAAPLSTSGSACNSLIAERGNTGRSMSPSEADQCAIAIHHRHRAAVEGLHGVAAPCFDQDRVHAFDSIVVCAATVACRTAHGQCRPCPLTALLLVLAAALLHALWNIVAKKAGGDHHFALITVLMTCLLWAPVALWFGLAASGRAGACSSGPSGAQRPGARAVFHCAADGLPQVAT